MRVTSIRARLTLWCVVVLAVTVTGYSIVLAVSLARGLEAGIDHVLGEAARQAAIVTEAASTERELDDEIRHLNVHTIVSVYDATDGRLLAGRPLAVALDLAAALQDRPGYVQTLSLPDGASWRVWTQVVASPGQPDRLLVIGRSSTFVQIALTELLMIISVSAPFVFLVAVVGGIFLASRALNPIDQITRTAEAISAEDLSRRLGLRQANDEVGRLAATFDHMLDRLDGAFERQRRFTADASHELRTPLAMLVSRAGMALQHSRSQTEYEEVLRAIRDEGLHMGRIVNDLLLLARADAGTSLAQTERLDTGEILASVADALRPIAAASGVTLNVLSEAGVQVLGDQTRLTQLMINLVDNALAHTPRGGSIDLRVRCDAGAALVEVTDTGSGIAPEHLPHVFKRFYRAPNGHSRERGGAGLGLALCRSIALAHGGTIDLHSDAGHGTRAAIRLPLAAGVLL
ncbi:MAG TPA: ATP-binding protein [Chloroflexota bacterium]|nr:ATP-binding protein [Chloroflexota bacterium]